MSAYEGLAKVHIILEGIAPGLLQQSKGVMIEDANNPKPVKRSPEEEAKLRTHWLGEGKKKQCSVPWVAIFKCLCKAAAGFKVRGIKSLPAVIAGSVSCEHPLLSLGTDKYEVYTEWVRIPPRTGAVVLIGRPLFREWKLDFNFHVAPEKYAAQDVSVLQRVFEDAGKIVGIGAWRPQLLGPYGKFKVSQFEIDG